MSRIKIRVSAGVFEVSLIRVIEETGAVEVLWDRGVKREFKWGSVVFGNTDGPVLQKPSEMQAVEPKREFFIFLVCGGQSERFLTFSCHVGPSGALVAPMYPSIHAATHFFPSASPYPASSSATPLQTERPPSTSTSAEAQAPHTSSATATSSNNLIPTLSHQYTQGQIQSMYPSRTPGTYADYWAYAAAAQAQYAQGQTAYGSAQTSYQYPYGAYYGSSLNGGGQQQQYNPYTSYAQAYARSSSQHPGGILNWQQPYQGPLRTAVPGATATTGQVQATLSQTLEGSQTVSSSSPSLPGGAQPVGVVPVTSSTSSDSTKQTESSSSAGSTPVTGPLSSSSTPSTTSTNLQQHQQAMKDLAALSLLEPSQIADILLGNPQLREMVLAAVEQAKLTVLA